MTRKNKRRLLEIVIKSKKTHFDASWFWKEFGKELDQDIKRIKNAKKTSI